MGNLHPLARLGKHDGVIADDVTGTNSLETYRLAVTFTGNALPAINGTFLEIATQRISNDFSQT